MHLDSSLYCTPRILLTKRTHLNDKALKGVPFSFIGGSLQSCRQSHTHFTILNLWCMDNIDTYLLSWDSRYVVCLVASANCDMMRDFSSVSLILSAICLLESSWAATRSRSSCLMRVLTPSISSWLRPLGLILRSSRSSCSFSWISSNLNSTNTGITLWGKLYLVSLRNPRISRFLRI